MQWDIDKISQLFDLPFLELIYRAQSIHRENFDNSEIELCSIYSIKTGTCPEDCAYCPQSGHYKTGVQKEKLWDIDTIITHAKEAKARGATRVCLGAAWRNPPLKQFSTILNIIREVKKMDIELCMTLGMLTEDQAYALKEAGLDFYNHNIDTSPDYYSKIISTHTYQDRLDTIEKVAAAKLHVCCGGIMGMGESRNDRLAFIHQLTQLKTTPRSIPINRLIPIKGTPLAHTPALDNFEFIRVIAVIRIIFPDSIIRLSAGRAEMSHEMQTLCFLAGANSMWLGEKLLTAENPAPDKDKAFLDKLGLQSSPSTAYVN